MRGAVEAVATYALLLVPLVGQAVEVGIGRQRLVEGGIEHRDMRDAGKELHRLAHAFEVVRIVQRRQCREGLDVGQHLRRDHRGAGELAAAMDHAVADGDDVQRGEQESVVELEHGLEQHVEEFAEGEGRPFAACQLAGGGQGDVYAIAVRAVDHAVHIQRLVMRIVDAEADLGQAGVNREDLAVHVLLQAQRIGIVGLRQGTGAQLAAGDVHRLGARAVGKKLGEVQDGLGIDQDVATHHILRNQQHQAAIAGDDVGHGAIPCKHRHFAEHVADFQRAHDDAATGVVGHRDFPVAIQQYADETPLLAALDNGLVAFKGAQFGTFDNGPDVVSAEALEQRRFFQQEGNQFIMGHGLPSTEFGELVDYYIAALHKY